jgi:hypothetical protein
MWMLLRAGRHFGVVVVRLVGSLCALRWRLLAVWRCRLCLGLATPCCVVEWLSGVDGAACEVGSRSRCATVGTQSRNAKIRGEIAPPDTTSDILLFSFVVASELPKLLAPLCRSARADEFRLKSYDEQCLTKLTTCDSLTYRLRALISALGPSAFEVGYAYSRQEWNKGGHTSLLSFGLHESKYRSTEHDRRRKPSDGNAHTCSHSRVAATRRVSALRNP